MNYTALQLLVALAALVYFVVTLIIVRRKPGLLWLCAALVALGGITLYWQAYSSVQPFIPHIVMSILTGLDLFLFRAYTIGMVSNFFFGEGNIGHLIILYGLMLCAVWTTSLAAIHVFARKLESRIWLWYKTIGRSSSPVHLIVGVNPRSISLARSLKGKGRVVVLDDAAPVAGPRGKMDFFGVLKGIRVESPLVSRLRREAPWAAVLKGTLALRRLDRWLRLETTSVYLLSEDYSANIASALRLDRRGVASVWFVANEDELTLPIDITHKRLHLIDPSALAISSLKREEELYPVRCVDVARDAEGHRLGYVNGGFDSVVVGSEEFAAGVRGFLQEWAAFVGKDKKQVPLVIDVLEDIPADRFATLNWVGVCFDDDETTMRKALDIAKQHFMSEISPLACFTPPICNWRGPRLLGRDDNSTVIPSGAKESNFLIAARLDRPSVFADTLRFSKENYGVEIVPFGQLDKIWTYDSITGGDTARFARIFYDGYRESAGGGLEWDERNAKILESDHSDLWNAMELRRKVSQDYSDYFHRRVKTYLCDLFQPEFDGVWKDIPVKFEGKHYTGADPAVGAVLEYLSIGEHLRWEASHRAAGYRPGPRKEEDRMTHTDLVPYDALSGVAQHYDWIVVRTSLRLK
ncbi:MAG: hypothetical protein J5667_03130 [Bacteroidales bacterium]|nr:hypothetical protein [Bacteroidales bacterium]